MTDKKKEEAPKFQVSDDEMNAILQRVALWHYERGDTSWALVNEGSGVVIQGGNRLKIAALLGATAKIAEAEVIEPYVQLKRAHEAAHEQAKAEAEE